MEQLNRVEIRGVVGSSNVATYPQGKVAHFRVATNHAYKDRQGADVIETTWHNVTAWEGREIKNLDNVVKGAKVYVVGRFRNQKYESSDGQEKSTSEIQAYRLVFIEDAAPLSCEF